jgi:hypothetical protein
MALYAIALHLLSRYALSAQVDTPVPMRLKHQWNVRMGIIVLVEPLSVLLVLPVIIALLHLRYQYCVTEARLVLALSPLAYHAQLDCFVWMEACLTVHP